jgi:oxazoline/thiazoline synthase
MSTENPCAHSEPAVGPTLYLRKGFRLFVLSPVQAILLGEGQHAIINGEVQVAVARLIDGTHTDSEIVEILSVQADGLQALAILEQFKARGICTHHVSSGPAEDMQPCRQEQNAPFHLLIDCFPQDRHAALVEEALQRAGFCCGDNQDASDAALHVVVTHDFFDPRIEDIAKRNRARNRPWLLVKPTGATPMAVPFTPSGTGPCLTCLTFWLRVNRPVEEYIRRKTGQAAFAETQGFEPATRILAELTAATALRLLQHREHKDSEIVAIDPQTLQHTTLTLRKRPQCPVCGNPEWMTQQGFHPIALESVEKGHCEDGGFRHQPPAVTYEQFKHLVSPITGPVSHLGPMPKRHTLSRPVFVSGYRACPEQSTVDGNSFQRVCAGKGRSPEQAKVSALFEAVERFSGLYQGDEAIIQGSWNDRGPEAYHPHALQLFSDAQYAAWTPKELDKTGALRQAKRYTENEPIDWTPAWSLTHNCRRFVPFAYCYSDTPSHINRANCNYNGNGVAAGLYLEEAILQGLFELVERDAVAIWWYNQLERPHVGPHMSQDPYMEKMKAEYQQQGWDLWVLDLTHDLAIPVYAALAQSRQDHRFSIGFGCHLDAKLALYRALTELNQLFDPQGQLRTPWDQSAMASDAFLFPHGTSEATPQDRSFPSSDLRSDINECIHRLDRVGLEISVVDKSRPDTGIHVAHVIVPGLRHFWPRFGPGRLYTVPVAMGWRSSPLTEAMLNPIPLLV